MAKLHEADLVNQTAKDQLSKRNQEPTHLDGAKYDELGGRTVDMPANSRKTKIDATKGVGKDTSIPHAVEGEKSHLPNAESVEDKMDLAFGNESDHTDVDDLDKELDDLDDLHEIEIEVGKKDDDDSDVKKDKDEKKDEDDDKKVDEEDNDVSGSDPVSKKDVDAGKLSWPDVQEDDDEPKKDDDDEDKFNFDKKKDVDEEDENPFAKKDKDDDDKEDDDNDKEDKDKTKITVKEDDKEEGDDDKPKFNFDKKKDDDDKKVEERFQVRISMPQANLFESAGIAPKTQRKVAVIFEQAIRSNTKQIAKQLHEHYAKKYRRQITERDSVMQTQVDAYLSFVVEEWCKANKVAIRTSLRAQLAEEFLDGLRGLFNEHYIDVPESKIDVVSELTKKLGQLKETNNQLIADRIKLRRLAESANKARIVAEFATGLSANETSRLGKLAEDVKYDNAKDFRGKLALIKESYLGKKDSKDFKQRLAEENVEDVKKPAKKSDPSDIGSLVSDAISQAAKSNW